MKSLNLIESFSEFKEFKNIDRETMMSVIEDVFRSLLKKKYGTDKVTTSLDIGINITHSKQSRNSQQHILNNMISINYENKPNKRGM